MTAEEYSELIKKLGGPISIMKILEEDAKSKSIRKYDNIDKYLTLDEILENLKSDGVKNYEMYEEKVSSLTPEEKHNLEKEINEANKGSLNVMEIAMLRIGNIGFSLSLSDQELIHSVTKVYGELAELKDNGKLEDLKIRHMLDDLPRRTKL